MTTVPTSEVLNRAADAIERYGWIGKGGQGWHPEKGGPLCIEGAIAAAMGPSIDVYGGFTGGPNRCPAGNAVRDYLGMRPYEDASNGLYRWNDELRWDGKDWHNVRTAAEVIEVLRAVAVIEAAREQQDAKWTESVAL